MTELMAMTKMTKLVTKLSRIFVTNFVVSDIIVNFVIADEGTIMANVMLQQLNMMASCFENSMFFQSS